MAIDRKTSVTKIRIMAIVLTISVVITASKFFAYHITGSNAILTDALESLINIVATSFGLFTLVYSARPKDENHPYGHGKMEFVAVGVEGSLIFFGGIGMIVKSVHSFFNPHQVDHIDFGLLITGLTAVANLIMGVILIRRGKSMHSATLRADGLHLISDTYSSAGLIIGLLIIRFTGLVVVDLILAVILGIYILITGYRLLRNSIAGLMDESDFDLIEELIAVINKERKANWIDIHNLRLVRYGASLHVDLHLTLPWYDQLRTSHAEVKLLEEVVNQHFENRIEFFIHTDPCSEVSCEICSIANCPVREFPFKNKIEWTTELLMRNEHHVSRRVKSKE